MFWECILILLKMILLKYIEKLNRKNIALMKKFRNIFNTMNSPLISINFKKNVVFFNAAFTNFIKQNYSLDTDGIKYLFDETDDNDVELNFIIDFEANLFFDKLKKTLEELNIKKIKKF